MVDNRSPNLPPVASHGRRTLHFGRLTISSNNQSDDSKSVERRATQPGQRDLVALYARRLSLLAKTQGIQEPLRYQERTLTRWATVEPQPFGKTKAERTPPSIENEQQELESVGASTPAFVPPRTRRERQFRFPAKLYRLVTAAFIATLLLGGVVGQALAQQRYRVQNGDTLDGIAAEFGVDAEAILRSSWMQNPPNPAPGEVLIIPDPGQSPGAAAEEAATLEGTSPWVSAAYYVEAGDSIEAIADLYGVDPDALLSFNDLTWATVLEVGQRMLIPASREDISGEVSTDDTSTDPDSSRGVPADRGNDRRYLGTGLRARAKPQLRIRIGLYRNLGLRLWDPGICILGQHPCHFESPLRLSRQYRRLVGQL